MTHVLAWLATYWIHSTILLGAVALVTWRFVQDDAWRETLWKTALIGGLVTASLQTWAGFRPLVGRVELDAPPPSVRQATPPVTATERPDRAAPATTTDPGPIASAAGTVPRRSQPVEVPWQLLLFAAWGVAAAVLLGRLVVRHRRLGRALAVRRAVDHPPLQEALQALRRRAALRRPVRLTVNDWCPTPLAVGRSEICLPARLLTDRPFDEQRGALAHEVAHLVRNDPVWQLAAAVVESLCFFQPLNGLARRRLRDAAEHLCDDWAARQTGSPLGLARCLVEVATWVGNRDDELPTAAAAMAEHGSALLQRVERLLAGRRSSGPGPSTRMLAVAGVLVLLAGSAPVIAIARPHAVTDTVPLDPPPRAVVVDSAPAPATQDGVVRHPDPEVALTARWAWARDQVTRESWVAWRFASLIGPGDTHISDSEGWARSGLRARPALGTRLPASSETVDGRDVIVLMRMDRDGRLLQVAARSPGFGFDLDGRTVYWLGGADAEQSFAVLRRMFQATLHAGMRETLVDVIAVHPGPDVGAFLVDVLRSRDTEVIRAEAAEALAWHATSEIVALLRDVVIEDKSSRVRQQAAEALGATRRADARDALIEIVAVRVATEVAHQAVEALGNFVDDVSRDALRTVIQTYPDDDVRSEAIEVLAGWGYGAASTDLLVDVALHDRSDRLARDAVEQLAERRGDDLGRRLRGIAFEAASAAAQRQAAEELGSLPPAAALPILEDIIDRHRDEDVIQQAVESVGRLRSDRAVQLLDAVVRNHWSYEARREALDQLESIGWN